MCCPRTHGIIHILSCTCSENAIPGSRTILLDPVGNVRNSSHALDQGSIAQTLGFDNDDGSVRLPALDLSSICTRRMHSFRWVCTVSCSAECGIKVGLAVTSIFLFGVKLSHQCVPIMVVQTLSCMRMRLHLVSSFFFSEALVRGELS